MLVKKYHTVFKKIYKLRCIFYIFQTKSKMLLILGILKNLNSRTQIFHYKIIECFRKFCILKNIDNEWKNNTKRFISWAEIFLLKYKRDENLRILEIGSCQGHSALFFLWFFKNSYIECVDVWDRFTKYNSFEKNS